MANDEYVENARKQRESPNVLLLRVLQIRSGDPDSIILVFEGVDDVGPYEVWLKTLKDNFDYVALPSTGKKQVLEFAQKSLSGDQPDRKLYFFIDHDFDGLRGVDAHNQIFCTHAYSIENYLCTLESLISLLVDEFRLAGRQKAIDQIVALFQSVKAGFAEATRGANLRLYCANQHSLRDGNVDNRIGRYLIIKHDTVEENASADITQLIPLRREPTAAELAVAEQFFNSAPCFFSASRGKYLLSFFLVWLEALDSALKNNAFAPCDGQEAKTKFRRHELNLRNLASRVSPPAELKSFILSAFDVS
jgi:hypothetical protein